MNFAFLIFKYFPFGGVQRDMLRIAQDCAVKGHKITIYTGQWRGEMPSSDKGNLNVVLLPYKGFLNHQRHQSLINAFEQRLQIDRPDFVVGFNKLAFMSGAELDVYYAADPCFMEKAHFERSWLYRLTGRYHFFARSEKAVMNASGYCKTLLLAKNEKVAFQRWYGTPDSRFYLLPPSIPSVRFAEINRDKARLKLRAEFGLPPDAKVVLMVGSAFVRKGLDRAIEALASLPPVLQQNTWLLAVGEDSDSMKMRTIAQRLDIASKVIITSGRNDVPELMVGADCLVHAARSELAGIVLIEALTAGLPTVVTDNCGYAFHVKNADAGYVLASPFRQQELNTALLDVLKSNKQSEWVINAQKYTSDIAVSTSKSYEADLIENFALDKIKKISARNQKNYA